MGIHACAPKGTDCPALALGSSDARESDLARRRPADGSRQPGSYQLAGRVSIDKRPRIGWSGHLPVGNPEAKQHLLKNPIARATLKLPCLWDEP